MREANELNRTIMLVTILERGKGNKLTRFMEKHKISTHLEFPGHGTATSEMRDLLGGSKDKDIIVSFGTKKSVESLIHSIDSGLWEISRGHGLMMQLSPSAVNNLTAAVLIHNSEELNEPVDEVKMKNQFEHSLILMAVKQGFTDQVMQTARKAGAVGGTVIRSRLMGAELFEENLGIRMDEEKEIIAILAAGNQRDAIMEAVNSEFGLRSPAQSILCSLPVDRAFKI